MAAVPEIDHRSLARVLDILGAPAQIEVLGERQDLLRFGASRITYQHSEERLRLRVKLIRDGRAAWGTTETLEPEALRALRQRLEGLMVSLPAAAGGAAAVSEPGPALRSAQTSYPMTDTATPESRVALLTDLSAALPSGAVLGGSIAHSTIQHAIGTTAGLFRNETRTRAAVQVIAEHEGCTSFARVLHRDPMAVRAQTVTGLVAAGLAPLPPRPLESGSYRAVLGPQAVITLAAILGQIALNARAYHSGQSAFSSALGDRVASDAISMVDDGCDEVGLPTTFDCEGTPKQRVPLIEHGVLCGVVYDRETAVSAGVVNTGHAVPTGWRFGAGPCPSHLLIEPGSATDDDLIAACDRGIAIQRVDYVRVLHARETLVTGTTRDATLWIEGGRVVGRLPQFRFTLRLADLFRAVERAGRRRERGETVFMESIVAPALLINAFPVGTVTAT